MKYLKVNLWGKEIGRLVWNSNTRRTHFVHNPETGYSTPDITPLLAPMSRRSLHLPIYGDERPLYQGLPPFIADSLPDSWGNTLFDKWVKDNKVPRNKVTPLYKLMFIGSRGMGALEYEPCAEDLNHTQAVDIQSLYDMSAKILESRDNIVLNTHDQLTLQALLSVGTSAGGRQMKAIIAINDKTGEIRSGQTDCLEGFDYYILKFGDRSMPMAEIETAYYVMARSAGIIMEECRLFPVEGMNHFLTRRFDRRNGRKVYVQTLAAVNPEAGSYEDLVMTCRELRLPESEIEQVFARMVFNVMANNTDDHNKNFSFILDGDNHWRLAPAYDVTFIFNTYGTGPNPNRRLSINGKTSGITKNDLIDFAKQNNISNANSIIDKVADAIRQFAAQAEACGITQPWRSIIQKSLNDTLADFGYIEKSENSSDDFYDENGRLVCGFSISVNSKGHYEISAVVDGHRRRRFIKQNMLLYDELNRLDLLNLPLTDRIRLAGTLFDC